MMINMKNSVERKCGNGAPVWLMAALTAAGLGWQCAAVAGDTRFAVAAYNHFGSLESAVSADGRFTATFPPNSPAVATAAASDAILNRLYVGGHVGGDSIAIARYDYQGNLDTNFGSGGQVVTQILGGRGTPPGQRYEPLAVEDIAIDSSNRIVVVGYNEWQVILVRYLPDGTLDTSFAGDGILRFGPFEGYERFRGMGVAIDGQRIVISGDAHLRNCFFGGLYAGYNGGILIARFEANGQPDAEFGAGTGYVIDHQNPEIHGKGYCGYDPYGGGLWNDVEEARDVAVDSSGRVVVAGVIAWDDQLTHGAPGVYDIRYMEVRRYLSDGQLDPGFGDNAPFGVQPFGYPGPWAGRSHGNAVVIDALGRIVVAGQARWGTESFAVARLTAGGLLDTTFNGDGRILTGFGNFGTSEIKDIALGADGDVIAGGWSGTQTGNIRNFALARYRSDGNPETNFHVDGKLTTDFTCDGNESIEAIALRPFFVGGYPSPERIFAAGWSEGEPCASRGARTFGASTSDR